MLLDKTNMFSEAQACTGTKTAIASSNTIDLGTDGAPSGGMWLVVNVDTVFAGTAGSTLTIALQSDDDSACGSPTSLKSYAIALATLAAGANVVKDPLPSITERYLRLTYTTSVSMSTGKLDAFLAKDVQTNLTGL